MQIDNIYTRIVFFNLSTFIYIYIYVCRKSSISHTDEYVEGVERDHWHESDMHGYLLFSSKNFDLKNKTFYSFRTENGKKNI